eukprot:1348224-Pleurochrysis_carterae.AAC.2
MQGRQEERGGGRQRGGGIWIRCGRRVLGKGLRGMAASKAKIRKGRISLIGQSGGAELDADIRARSRPRRETLAHESEEQEEAEW